MLWPKPYDFTLCMHLQYRDVIEILVINVWITFLNYPPFSLLFFVCLLSMFRQLLYLSVLFYFNIFFYLRIWSFHIFLIFLLLNSIFILKKKWNEIKYSLLFSSRRWFAVSHRKVNCVWPWQIIYLFIFLLFLSILKYSPKKKK